MSFICLRMAWNRQFFVLLSPTSTFIKTGLFSKSRNTIYQIWEMHTLRKYSMHDNQKRNGTVLKQSKSSHLPIGLLRFHPSWSGILKHGIHSDWSSFISSAWSFLVWIRFLWLNTFPFWSLVKNKHCKNGAVAISNILKNPLFTKGARLIKIRLNHLQLGQKWINVSEICARWSFTNLGLISDLEWKLYCALLDFSILLALFGSVDDLLPSVNK